MDRPLIVVIEDDVANAWGLSLVLHDWGFDTVTGASLPPVAAEIDARGACPAAAICDLDLGAGANGIDVALALRRRYRAALPVLILTARPDEVACTGVSLPVLAKPVDPDLLHAHLGAP